MNRMTILVLGIAAVIAVTWAWHGPLGAGDRFAADIERRARVMLDHDEMVRVDARLERGPLSRRLVLSGPADDYQRAEIKRRMETIAGVGEAAWSPASLPAEQAP
jgi:hypothetical protein